MTRTRLERFGAWVSLPDATLVAIDRTRARSLGLDGGALWDDTRDPPHPRPLEVHIAVTQRCPVECAGCYQDAGPAGEHVARASLDATLDAAARAGVFTVAFGGGEPLSRPDLADVGRAAVARGLVPVFTTSGLGLTRERADELRASGFAQVNVSHDGVDGGYRAVRGFDGGNAADRAIELLTEAGFAVGVNLVLTRQSFAHVEPTADHVRTLGARELQLLRYKPAGRAAQSLAYLDRRLTPAQTHALHPLLGRLAARHADALSVRIDCALVPFLSPWVTEGRALERWGVFGCEAGRHLAAVTRDGNVAPCSFERASEDGARDFDTAWDTDALLNGFRAFVQAPPEPCASCAIRAACRGGCKVVSEHLTGERFVPDPECPRVMAHARENASCSSEETDCDRPDAT